MQRVSDQPELGVVGRQGRSGVGRLDASVPEPLVQTRSEGRTGVDRGSNVEEVQRTLPRSRGSALLTVPGRPEQTSWLGGRRASIRAVAARLTWLSLLAFSLAAQESGSPAEPADFVIRTESNLVLTPFYVVHKKKYVEGLTREDLRIFEDGREQEIALFEGPGVGGAEAGRSVPVEIILLLDVSLSVMNRSLLDVYTLQEELLEGLGDNVSVGIYAFANKLTRLTRPTRDLAWAWTQPSVLYNWAEQAGNVLSRGGGCEEP